MDVVPAAKARQRLDACRCWRCLRGRRPSQRAVPFHRAARIVSALVAALPDELIDDPCNVLTGHRPHPQLPAAAVGMLGKPRRNSGTFEKSPNDRRAAVALATRPLHVYAEAEAVERPDRELVGASWADGGGHETNLGIRMPKPESRALRLGVVLSAVFIQASLEAEGCRSPQTQGGHRTSLGKWPQHGRKRAASRSTSRAFPTALEKGWHWLWWRLSGGRIA